MFQCGQCHVTLCFAQEIGSPLSRGPCEHCGELSDCSDCKCDTKLERSKSIKKLAEKSVFITNLEGGEQALLVPEKSMLEYLHDAQKASKANPEDEVKKATVHLAQEMFAAYNEEGPNPWKTWDGKDVPRWDELNDQVRGKWIAAAKRAVEYIQG